MPTDNETFRRYLTNDVAAIVEKSYRFLVDLVERVSNGHIKMGELQWLLKHPQEFRHVVQTLLGDNGNWCHALQLRKRELEAFNSVKQDVHCALRLCQTFIKTSKQYFLSVCLSVCLACCLSVSLYLYPHSLSLTFCFNSIDYCLLCVSLVCKVKSVCMHVLPLFTVLVV